MKYRILVFVFALFIILSKKVFTQTLQNEVLASAGEAYTINNSEISWTLGESLIESYLSGNILISQGFHQPIFRFFEIQEQEKPVFHVSIYPNPTSRFVQIDVKGSRDIEEFNIILSDMMGKVLLNRLVEPLSHDQLDLAEYPCGILLLKINRVSDGMQRTFKIVRTTN
jgi:hypothetical protein